MNLNGIGVDSEENSGGLALLWSKQIQVDLVSFSKYHIDSLVRLIEDGDLVRVTCIYGHPDASQRNLTWDLIRTLYNGETKPWFLGGDFNEILRSSEKMGGINRGPGRMEAFSLALTDVGLADLGF